MQVKIGDADYDFSEEELEYLKSNLKRSKTFDGIDVAVYLGTLLLGYINTELIKKILKELKKL